MQSFNLELAKRPAGKDGARQKSDSQIYGVVYGHGLESTPVSGDRKLFEKLIKEAGTSHIIKLTIDGDKSHNALLKDLEYNPVTNKVRHFDFITIKAGEKITAEIPVILEGESPAVKVGNMVHQLIDSIEVTTVPSKLPESFIIDISKLVEVGDVVHVSDLNIDPEIEVDPEILEQPIVKIDAQREMEIEEETPVEIADEVAEVPSEHGAEEVSSEDQKTD